MLHSNPGLVDEAELKTFVAKAARYARSRAVAAGSASGGGVIGFEISGGIQQASPDGAEQEDPRGA